MTQIGNIQRFPSYQRWLEIINEEYYFSSISRIQTLSISQEIWVEDVINYISQNVTLRIGDGFFCTSTSYYLFVYIVQVTPIRYKLYYGTFSKIKNNLITETEPSHNRMVCANHLFGGLGYVRLGHGYAIPTPHSTTFFYARKNASHFSLSGAKNRRLQPERYAKYA